MVQTHCRDRCPWKTLGAQVDILLIAKKKKVVKGHTQYLSRSIFMYFLLKN